MTRRIHGVLAPVLTPFGPNLSPDTHLFIAHCKWLLSQNCGLAPFGTTSEANSLAAEERENLLVALVAAGVDPSRMMPGTGCCSITETVKLTRQAVSHGCAGVLMLPPFYYKEIGEEGLYRYFSEVVQRVGDARLKIYLYHIPPIAIVGITAKLVERLLKAYPDTIAGLKDSSGDWNNTKLFLDAFAVRTASPARSARAARTFDVFVGSESFLLANMCHGGAGTISATANVNPAAIDALYQRARVVNRESRIAGSGPLTTENRPLTSDKRPHSPRRGGVGLSLRERGTAALAGLEELQAKLNEVRAVFSSRKFPSMIAALKQAIAVYTNDPGWARVRPPLVELTTKQARALEGELKAIGFTMPFVRSDDSIRNNWRDKTKAN